MMARGKRIGAVLVEKEEKRGRHLVGGWCDEFLCGYSTVLRVRPYVRTYGRIVNGMLSFTGVHGKRHAVVYW